MKHKRKQEAYEVSQPELEARIRVLENRVGEMSVRNCSLGLELVNLRQDRDRLTRNVFERSVGFPPDMPLDEMDLIIDVLVWHCMETDGDANALATKYEMWEWDAEIKSSLRELMVAYSQRFEE